MTTTPRGPRPPVVRESPVPLAVEASPERIEAHGAIAIVDVPVVSTVEAYDGRWMTCRKPFKLNGEKYKIGDPVPVDMIPRPESWVRTGFVKEAS